MKNRIAIICILIMSSFSILSQPHEDAMINPFWDLYSFNYLNTESAGRGFTGIASDNNISGVLLNPASVILESKYQINAQYTYKTSNRWLTVFTDDMYIKQQLFSGSLGFGFRINKKFQSGLVYNNPTGMYFDGGKIIGDVEYYNDVMFHSFNVPFVYSEKNFRLGININYIHARVTTPGEVHIPPVSENISATNNHFRVGIGFVNKFKNGLSIGFKSLSGGRSTVSYENPPGVIQEEETSDAVYPWKFGAGLQYDFKAAKFKILFDYNLTYHNMENLAERHDFHFGIEKELAVNWIVRGGFFTLLDYRKDSPEIHWIDPIGEYSQYFITIGLGYKQKDFQANISALTSEISPGMIKTTYLNGGLTFNF
jgi:hypothetical protein